MFEDNNLQPAASEFDCLGHPIQNMTHSFHILIAYCRLFYFFLWLRR